ncbi:cilium assembly protein DZIP1 isoform X2 [Paralichthys olivaceus]|uniref:cilium assembly protein DZIP1 isoform X2 n=1 Tax=Paralichthys olivaceus TaxID=8255 RepID=UPI003751129B
MPFHNGIYYPYTSDTQGTHSSAGIPSLLNSPLSQHSVNGHCAPAAGMTPSSGTSTFLPFKFRPRREMVDWQRINAVDINLVMSQLDVDVLQDHISSVTFCSLDGERCQRCRSPVDPALLKLLQLAQLTVEWLLHCQEFLSLNLHAAEERLGAASREHKQLLEQQSKQEEKVKALDAELKLRKKDVRDLQSQLLISSQKCQICHKAFLTPKFLQSHMQRRHPEEQESQLRSDNEKKSQIEILKMEISSLREQNVQLQQNLQLKAAQEKEQQSTQKDLLRELDRFKAEEMTRMERKIEDTRESMHREMESMYNRNIQAVNELNQNQISKLETSADSAHLQTQIIQELKKQYKMWESMLKKNKEQHESEKNQLLDKLSRIQVSLSEQHEQSPQLQQEMGRRPQEKQQTIKVQREQTRNISSNTPTKVMEVPVVVSAPAPEPKPKRVVLEEPVFALKLDPIQELSEEEKDSSSVSERRPVERRPVERKPEPAPQKKPSQSAKANALKRNPSVKKEMRPELEQAVAKKLENLGVKPNQSGLKNRELTSILAKVHSKRDSVAKEMPEYWRCREEISGSVDEKMSDQTRESPPEPQARSRHSVQVLQILPRSSSLPSSATQVMCGPAVRQSKTPQPAPRAKSTAYPKTSTPNSKAAPRTFTPKTPPFSSDEESEEEDMEEEQPPKHQRGKSPLPKIIQATPVQIRAGKTSPVQARQAVTRQPFSSGTQLPRGSVGVVTKTAVTKIESDDEDEEEEEWSEVSELQEIDSKQLQGYKDQNGNVDKRNYKKENKITVLTRKMEQKFAERAAKKPAGGVSLLTERRDEVQELTYTDLEESSDWVVSSLEDRQEVSKPAQRSGPLRKSLDSPSTSVWGTSTGKAPKSGLTEAGTGSTLKSSLCSLSDFSDSEDTSNKHSRHYS